MSPASGNRCVRPPSGAASGVPCDGDEPAGKRARRSEADLLPEHGARRELEAVDRAREAQPG